jgi:hypothetical protein
MLASSITASLLVSLAPAALGLTTCLVPSNYAHSNGTASDAAAIADAFATCSKDAVIEFQEGIEYNVFSPVKATNLSNVVISLKGNWSLPQNITAVQSFVNASGGSLYWFQLGGSNVQLLGSPKVRDPARPPSLFRCLNLTNRADHYRLDQVVWPGLVGCKPSQRHRYSRATAPDVIQRAKWYGPVDVARAAC